MRSGWMALAAGLACSMACPRVAAAMVVDGNLDEPEWREAQHLASFKTTDPYTLAEPDLKTEVLVLSKPDGLWFGFICDQPPWIDRVRSHGQRDQYVPGDRVNIMLDFDGSGTTAYEFTGYLGGEYMDAVISRQTNYNYDWDSEWQYAVSETSERWFAEFRIPWTTAPLAEPKDAARTIGVFVSRVVAKTGARYSQPGNGFTRATFVADMQKLTVAAYDRAQLDVYPYIAGSYDTLKDSSKGRAGLDLFWKPSGTQQLTATVNPDFGQVESDQLVVNFSAIPTFFTDKRPFFTENFALFSTDINVLYTRRIGAAPDAGPEGVSDIAGALKYTGTSGDLAYGAIAAVEDDSSQADGRRFYVARARQKWSDALTFGWMGTYTDRPTLDRHAEVSALDLAWTIAPGVSLSTQDALTHVAKASDSFFSPNGTGNASKTTFTYAPGGRFDETLYLVSKSQSYNINDAGFQQRPSEYALQSISNVFWRDWAKDSPVQQQYLNTNLLYHRNDSGDALPGSMINVYESGQKDTSFIGLEWDALTLGGVDDLITRGNGKVRLPARHQIFPYYGSPRSGMFRYLVVGGFGTGYFERSGFQYVRVEPGLYPGDSLNWTLIAGFLRQPDELIWQGAGNLLGAFDYLETNVSSDINWFPAERHSLRVKFQWIAASGDHGVAYRPGADGGLGTTADPIPDFHFTTTAIQLRYRWEFRPQSEFFLVYSRGGYEDDAGAGIGERSYADSLRRGLSEVTDSQFLAKVRYRFAIL